MYYNLYYLIMLETWRLNFQLNINEPLYKGFLKYYNGKSTCKDIIKDKETHRDKGNQKVLILV